MRVTAEITGTADTVDETLSLVKGAPLMLDALLMVLRNYTLHGNDEAEIMRALSIASPASQAEVLRRPAR